MAPDTFACPRCEGRGFLGFDAEPGDRRFGQITPCPACLQNGFFQGQTGPSEGGLREKCQPAPKTGGFPPPG